MPEGGGIFAVGLSLAAIGGTQESFFAQRMCGPGADGEGRKQYSFYLHRTQNRLKIRPLQLLGP